MGHNLNRIISNVNYVSITGTFPSKNYWDINQSITYSGSGREIILSLTAGIVDTGTTLILIAIGSILAIMPQSTALN
jgi:hypothetical protein